jgi:predicted permease
MDNLMHDVRDALRLFTRTPGFTVVALVILGLGTGGNVALFTLLDALVLRSLPVNHPDRLVAFSAVNTKLPFETGLLPLPALPMFAQQQDLFTVVGGYLSGGVTFTSDGVPSQLGIEAVTGQFFGVLEMQPALGRLITNDDVATSAPVAVVSYGYWQRRYAGDPHVLGTTVRLQGVPFTVVGVTPRRFWGMEVGLLTDVTIPISTVTQVYRLPADYPLELAHGIGRLRADVSLERARSQLHALWPGVLRAVVPTTLRTPARDEFLARQLEVASAATGFSYLRDWYETPLYLLVAATGWLLVMTCANLASLLLARATARQQEMRVRSALGASRGRLVRHLLTESVLLSVTGTVIGLPVAWWVTHALIGMMWVDSDILPLDLTPDWRVTIVIGVSAVATGLAVGILPACRATREDQAWPFQATRPTVSATSRWTEHLLVAQVALAVVLLVGAGLLTRSLQQLRGRLPGFDIDGVSLSSLQLLREADAQLVGAYSRTLVDRLLALPGVSAAALSVPVPVMGLEAGEVKQTVSPSASVPHGEGVVATVVAISPEFFRTMGVPLNRGRDFTWVDDAHHTPVAILSASLAGILFPGREAIGQPIRVGVDRRRQQVEIVGVTADARLADLHTMQPTFVFVPLLQESLMRPTAIEVRSPDRSALLQARIRRTVDSLGQDYVVRQRTLAEQVDTSLLRERLLALGTTYFGGLAAALVAVGLCGVLSYAVTRRTREMGIRAALGASAATLRAMVLKQTLRVAALGVGIGLPGAWVATRIIRTRVAGIDAHDPITFVGAAIVVMVISLAAASVPARRAATIEPMEALRCE